MEKDLKPACEKQEKHREKKTSIASQKYQKSFSIENGSAIFKARRTVPLLSFRLAAILR